MGFQYSKYSEYQLNQSGPRSVFFDLKYVGILLLFCHHVVKLTRTLGSMFHLIISQDKRQNKIPERISPE